MQFEKGNRLKSVIIKNKEYILYLIFGALTTFVNFLIYYLFTYILKVNYLISNCLAWLSAVIVAFVTNKTIVFNNYFLCKEEIEQGDRLRSRTGVR